MRVYLGKDLHSATDNMSATHQLLDIWHAELKA